MEAITKIRENARQHPKKIILPEFNDKRVVEAYEFIRKEKIAEVTLLYPEKLDAKLVDKFAQEFFELRKAKGITEEDARKTVSTPLYYGAMMVRDGLADGFVAGAAHTTSDVARAAIHCIGIDSKYNTVSSSFIMVLPNCKLGDKGVFVFADCGVIPDPNARQLANIAVTTAELARKVLGMTPRVAMLSYSTGGSAEGRFVNEVREATLMARQIDPGLLIDGELQVDAALVPEVARIKCPDSKIAGSANILIFPSLESGNISYKLTERLANARALGPLFQGVNKPCSDLSRGCSVEDVVDCVAVTAIRAQ